MPGGTGGNFCFAFVGLWMPEVVTIGEVCEPPAVFDDSEEVEALTLRVGAMMT